MAKSVVVVQVKGKKYQINVEDLKNVYHFERRKTPKLPRNRKESAIETEDGNEDRNEIKSILFESIM